MIQWYIVVVYGGIIGNRGNIGKSGIISNIGRRGNSGIIGKSGNSGNIR